MLVIINIFYSLGIYIPVKSVDKLKKVDWIAWVFLKELKRNLIR